MNKHFIKNIEIKNFKCFENFKAKGFGRVNLIGGKNNVGKTAFMEACYLSQSKNTKELFSTLLEIKTHRDIINNLLSKTTREEDIQQLIKDNINIEIFIKGKGGEHLEEEKDSEGNVHQTYTEWDDGKIKIEIINNKINIFTKYTQLNLIEYTLNEQYNDDAPSTYSYSELTNKLNLSLDSTKQNFSLNFISPYSNSNQELENIIGQSKLDSKYNELNEYLSTVFNVSSIDIIKNKPMLKTDNKFQELSHFGQGIKTFINIVSSMLLLKDDFIFIDEIENGIHYTNLDKLWEIILTIAKEQNVQVFATTHSKECIESYARVAKKLEETDIKFLSLYRNREDELKSITLDYQKIQDRIELGLDNR